MLVSHDLDFIRENATRVIYLDQNKIIYDGNVFNGIERYLINYGFFEFGKKFLENRLTSGPVSFGFVGPINKSFDYVELFTSHEPLMIGVEISSIERVQIQINFDLYCNDNLVSGYRGLPFCIEKTSDHSLKFSETIDTLNLNSGNYYSRISVFIKDINDKNIYLPLKITTKPFKVFANNILDEFLEYNGWAYPNTFVQLRSNLSIMRDK